jgi:hypothetical protein
MKYLTFVYIQNDFEKVRAAVLGSIRQNSVSNFSDKSLPKNNIFKFIMFIIYKIQYFKFI